MESAQSGSAADSTLELSEFTASAGVDWLFESLSPPTFFFPLAALVFTRLDLVPLRVIFIFFEPTP
jgi:hypothetical protein